MPPASPDEENQVHVLRADEVPARRGWLTLVLGLAGLLLLGGAGVFVWLNPDLLGGPAAEVVQLPPPAAGNLLGDGWSFEDTADGDAFTTWSVPEDAPPGFEFLPAGAHSGALGAVARPGEAGWCALQSRSLPLGAHRGAVRLAAHARGAGLALALRFESPGRPAIECVVAGGEGDLSGAARVPPGATAVRAVLLATGDGALDDVELRLVEAGADDASWSSGAFTLLAHGAHVLVFRGDELVLDAPGAALRAADGGALPPRVARRPDGGHEALALARGGPARARVRLEHDARSLTLGEDLDGLPADGVLVRTLLVGGSLAQAPVGLATAGGFDSFTGDFRVEGVRSVVLGRTQDRLALELDACNLSGTRHADGRWLLRAESPAAPSMRLVVRTSFQEERVAAAQHRDAALAAQAGGRLGEALAQAETVVARYPHDEQVLAEAATLRARLLAELQARLDRIDGNLQDALFLASARRCREVLAECEAAAAAWSGSAAEATFRERGRQVAARAADLLEADRARRASALRAVAESFRDAGHATAAAEIEDTLARWLAPPAESP